MTAERSATDRHIAAQIAANTKWGRQGDDERRAATEPARRGLRAKFEREADPDGLLTQAERIAGGERLMRAHMQKLAQLRRKKQAKRKAA